MSDLPEGVDRKRFEQKSAAMRRELERSKQIADHRAMLFQSRPNPAALAQPAANDAETKQFLESMAKFSPPANMVPPQQRGVPYPLGWRDIDRPKNLEWYGPDVNTGHCGAKLVSQAEGDFTAYCGVGVYVPTGSSAHTSTISWTTLLGFCDAGAAYFASAFSRTSILLTVDVHDGGEHEVARRSLSVNGANASPGGIWYEFHGYSDSGSLSHHWVGDPNATYSVWASVMLEVKTWGPAGAQANLHVIFNGIDPG